MTEEEESLEDKYQEIEKDVAETFSHVSGDKNGYEDIEGRRKKMNGCV